MISLPWPRRKLTLEDLINENLRRDPLDGPLVQLEADIFADDLDRYAPSAPDPHRPG